MLRIVGLTVDLKKKKQQSNKNITTVIFYFLKCCQQLCCLKGYGCLDSKRSGDVVQLCQRQYSNTFNLLYMAVIHNCATTGKTPWVDALFSIQAVTKTFYVALSSCICKTPLAFLLTFIIYESAAIRSVYILIYNNTPMTRRTTYWTVNSSQGASQAALYDTPPNPIPPKEQGKPLLFIHRTTKSCYMYKMYCTESENDHDGPSEIRDTC